jgi:capsular exopolysaccharide synthesis family protein
VQYHILQRQVASNQQLYDTMLQRSKEVAMSAALRATAVRVIDPARVPEKPYLPSLPLNLALGFVPALCIALALTSVRARTDRGLQGPGHAAALLNVAELGVIPRATAGDGWRVKSAGVRPRLSSGARALRHGPAVIDLVADGASEDTILQSFRGVLTSIMAGGAEDRPTALVITSFNPGEGKTTVTGNLAAVLAETGARVLVVDADLHSPRIHEVFDLPNTRGLTTLLALEHPPTTERLKECVQATPVPRVFALTAGPRHPLGSGLLYSRALAPLIDALRQHFDMVLIDSPPMLQIPDARLLGRVADGIVLVARAESTTTDEVLAVRQRLTADGTPVLGTILNAWRSGRSGYHQYGSYPGTVS